MYRYIHNKTQIRGIFNKSQSSTARQPTRDKQTLTLLQPFREVRSYFKTLSYRVNITTNCEPVRKPELFRNTSRTGSQQVTNFYILMINKCRGLVLM